MPAGLISAKVGALRQQKYNQTCLYFEAMTSKEFKRWLAMQGATFGTQRGSHLKVYLNGKQSVIPMHNADLKTGTV